jgi:CubicO group peptidase (beta-lactamase class C family)
MKRLFIFAFLSCIITISSSCSSIRKSSAIHSPYPNKKWAQIKKPETLGWSKSKLKDAKKYFKSLNSTSAMVIEDGAVIAAWGNVKKRVNSHSMRKSYLSALVGIAIDKGEFNYSKTLEQLGIDDDVPPALSKVEKQATIQDLLKARSGVYHPAAYETKNMKKRRPKRHSHKPGTFWYYNNWDFNALSTIYTQETGNDLFKAFKNLIASPIQMQDYRIKDGSYILKKDSSHAAYPISLSTRDRARFGLLFMQNGRWQGKQIISEKWIKESTKAYSKKSPRLGYGYMWWVNLQTKSYSARGYWGQYILVIPEKKLVIVHTSDKSHGDNRVSKAKFGKLLKYILSAKQP